MTIKQETQELETKLDNFITTISEMRDDFKRVNAHRHEHKRGIEDNHTQHQSISNHIEALETILKSILEEIEELRQIIGDTINRLQTLYMYSDADEDMRIDAEYSHRETLRELGLYSPEGNPADEYCANYI